MPGEIKYDDGTAENARAYNAAGNSWAVKMSLKEGEDQAHSNWCASSLLGYRMASPRRY